MNRIILLFAVIFGMSFTAMAQKTAYVNTQELLGQMPEANEAQKNFEAYYLELQGQFEAMQSEFSTKIKEYEEKGPSWSEIVLETKANELRDIERRINEFQGGIEAKIEKKQEEIFSPLLKKIQKAIEDVGKEEGYDYIYDAAGLLYAKDALNANSKVKVKLGIK